MFLIRNLLYGISNFLSHCNRHRNRKVLFQNITDSSLSGLAVDTDNIAVVSSSHIHWINRKIWNGPCLKLLFFSPCHAFCNGILMRPGKCREYKISGIRCTIIYLHSCQTLILFTNLWHISKVKLRIDTIGEHIHGKCNNIYITGTLTISEQCTLDTVSTC